MKFASALLVLISALSIGCGGGGGGGGSSVDLNGWWEIAARPAGSGTPFELAGLMPIAHTGSDVVFNRLHFTFDGSMMTAVDPGPVPGARSEYHLSLAGPDRMDGTVVQYAPDGSPTRTMDWRVLRSVPPLGTLTADGAIGGRTTTLRSSTAYAYAIVVTPDPGSTALFVADWHPDHANALTLRFVGHPPYAERSYAVTVAGGSLTASFDIHGGQDRVSGGTISIARVDGNRVTGSFDVHLETGGALRGTFDAAILVTLTDPLP